MPKFCLNLLITLSFRKKTDLNRLEVSMSKFTKFLSDDTGAVTIDWVALTAGILLLGIMVVYAIFNGGVASLAGNISSTLASVATDIDIGLVPNLNQTCAKTKKGIKCIK